jgi:predicted hydrocarbon binding protein
MILAMPPGIRKRMVVNLAQWMAQSTYGDTNVKVQWRQWRGSVELKSSLFCEVREHVESPLCEFYASALRRLMSTFNLDADVVMEQCRATGATRCAMSVTVRVASGRAA